MGWYGMVWYGNVMVWNGMACLVSYRFGGDAVWLHICVSRLMQAAQKPRLCGAVE